MPIIKNISDFIREVDWKNVGKKVFKVLQFILATIFSCGLFLLVYAGWKSHKYMVRLNIYIKNSKLTKLVKAIIIFFLGISIFGIFVIIGLILKQLYINKKAYGSFGKLTSDSVFAKADSNIKVLKNSEGEVVGYEYKE